jgi:hypothetical protein
MNNEPVAWMEADVLPLTHIIKAVVRREQDEQHTIPLYTHPAKELDEQFKKGFEAGSVEGWKAHKFLYPAKTLTDEEILNTLNSVKFEDMVTADDLFYMFARAILRKAQDK